MTVEEERRVIKNVLSGDKEAFSYIVDCNQRNVYALALRMTGSREDALDISQEVFIKVYLSLEKFKGTSRLSVWIYRITYNMCIDHIRKNAKEPQAFSVSDDDASDPVSSIPDPGGGPHSRLLEKELSQELSLCLELLPKEQRQVFIMRQHFNMSYDSIANELGISQGTVKSRLARARRALVENLKNRGTLDDFQRHK